MLEYEINNNIYPHYVTLVRMLALQIQTSNCTKKKKKLFLKAFDYKVMTICITGVYLT